MVKLETSPEANTFFILVSQNSFVTMPLSSFNLVFSNNPTFGVDPMPAIIRSDIISVLSLNKILYFSLILVIWKLFYLKLFYFPHLHGTVLLNQQFDLELFFPSIDYLLQLD